MSRCKYKQWYKRYKYKNNASFIFMFFLCQCLASHLYGNFMKLNKNFFVLTVLTPYLRTHVGLLQPLSGTNRDSHFHCKNNFSHFVQLSYFTSANVQKYVFSVLSYICKSHFLALSPHVCYINYYIKLPQLQPIQRLHVGQKHKFPN